MNKFLIVALSASAAFAFSVPAEARDGCGRGAHRGPAGYCRPDRRPVVVAPVLRVGVFYPGRGYWYAGRYWGHRYRWHGGWRYR